MMTLDHRTPLRYLGLSQIDCLLLFLVVFDSDCHGQLFFWEVEDLGCSFFPLREETGLSFEHYLKMQLFFKTRTVLSLPVFFLEVARLCRLLGNHPIFC